MSGIEQHVQSTRAAVDLPRRGKRRHLCRAPQDGVDQLAQHRSARSGAQSFAVYDPQAAGIALEARDQERLQLQFRRGNRQAMQIQFRLDAVLAAAQFAQRAGSDAGTGEEAGIRSRQLRFIRRTVRDLLEHLQSLRLCEPRPGARPGRLTGHPRGVPQRLHAARGLPEQGDVVLVRLGLHQNSPRRLLTGYIGPRLLKVSPHKIA